jgi:hypothetical protein
MLMRGRTISLLFSVIMALPLTFCVVTEIKQRQLKHDARERLEKINSVTVILSCHEFQWTEAGKEISIRGELFDLKSYSAKNGTFTFRGLFDKDETALDNLEHSWTNHQQENKLLTELFQILQSVFHNSAAVKEPGKKLTNQYPYLSPDKLSFQPKKIITPPPQA